MVNTLEKDNKQPEAKKAQEKISIRDGYLPIPILFILPNNKLIGTEIFIAGPNAKAQVYLKEDADFTAAHRDFLLKKDVRYIYVHISNYNEYLKAVINDASGVLTAKDLPLEDKCHFTYAILLALAKRIIEVDINRNTFVDVLKICKNIIPLFVKYNNTYKHFHSCMLHDHANGVHSANVSVMLTAFARKIGIEDEKILTHCCCGGILHDIGKRFTPSDILNNTGKLSDFDLLIAQNHVIEGIKAIDKYSKLPSRVMSIISEHHETIDGEGYPKKLKAKEISIYGKMIGIVDMFEAMTSSRPYRPAPMTIDLALAEIRGIAGMKVDKTIAGSFTQLIDDQVRNVTCSDDYFDGLILDDLGLTPEIGANPSGRRHERYYFRAKVRISKLSRKEDKWVLSDPQYMFCSNMSVSGLALINDKERDLNQMVRIELEMPEEYEEKVQAIGKIVRCVNSGSMFTIGVEFLKNMEEVKVQEIYNLLK